MNVHCAHLFDTSSDSSPSIFDVSCTPGCTVHRVDFFIAIVVAAAVVYASCFLQNDKMI